MKSFRKIFRLPAAVLAILALTAGLAAAAAAPATRTVTAGTGSGEPGQAAEVLIPITINYPDSVGVGGIAFTLKYDPAALTFLGLTQAAPGQPANNPDQTYPDGFKVPAGQIQNYPGTQTPATYYNPYLPADPYAAVPYTKAAADTLFFQYNELKDGSNNPLGHVLVAGASAEPLTATTLFMARFQIRSAAVRGATYPIQLYPSIIKNTAAGYSANGEFIPVLVGTGEKSGGLYNTTLFPVIPATLVAGGIAITGTPYSFGGKVTYGPPSNANAVGCEVMLYRETAAGYVFSSRTQVGNTGTYAFADVYPGNYKITVRSLDPGYDDYQSPSPIVLGNAPVANADAVLPAKEQVRVTGQVTRAAGAIPAGLFVKVVDPGDNVMGLYAVGADGKWTSGLLPKLASGSYSWYLIYGSWSSSKGATAFDAVLKSISGTLNGTGMPAKGFVTAISAKGNLQKTVEAQKGVVYTIADLLDKDDYIVSVVASGLPVTYYDAVTDIGLATPVDTSKPAAATVNFTFQAPQGHITGWVRNAGQGVTGISVYAYEVNTAALFQAATTAGGSYDLGVTVGGTYEVFVIKPNGAIFYFYDTTGSGIATQFESRAALRQVPDAVNPVANTNIDIAECDKTLTGKVTYRSSTGDPAVNVVISAFSATSRGIGFTGQDGRYTVGGLCDGMAYTVEMRSLSGNYPVQTEGVTISGADTTKDFVIDTGSVISGTVTDAANSNPVNGAMIFLKDQETGAPVGGRVYFSAGGAYEIRDVKAGSYTLEVTHPDYQGYSAGFLVGSEDVDHDVVLVKGAYLKGRVTDGAKNLSGVTIIVTRAGMTSLYAVTNSEGIYSVYGLVAGEPHTVMAQKAGYERKAQIGTPVAGGTTIDFVLTAPVFHTLSGYVETSASVRVKDAIVLVSSQAKNFFANANTDQNGVYTIPGLEDAADYKLVVIPPGNLPVQTAAFAVAGGNVTRNFTITLGETIGGTVSGPPAGSLVYVFLYKADEYIGYVDTTDHAFTFRGLTAGTDYKVLVVSTGYVSQWQNNIASGTQNLAITLVTQ